MATAKKAVKPAAKAAAKSSTGSNPPGANSRRSPVERYAMGKSLRDTCPRAAHAAWKAGPERPDPLDLIEASNKGRVPELIPIRHGRMMKSPFTFYRGAALNMAADLATAPATGLRVQACDDFATECRYHPTGFNVGKHDFTGFHEARQESQVCVHLLV